LVHWAGCSVIAHRTEWNSLDSFLPTTHWVECEGQRLDLADVAGDWGEAEFVALETSGFLQKLRRWEDPEDEFETSTFYLVNLYPEASVERAVALLQAARNLLMDVRNVFAGTRWTDAAAASRDICDAIEAVRQGATSEVFRWFGADGDFRRVGHASHWDELSEDLANRFLSVLPSLRTARGRDPGAGAAPTPGSRRMAGALVAVLLVLGVLFFLVNQLPPNPIGDSVQDWCLRRRSPAGGFGVIESQATFWWSVVGLALTGSAMVGAAAMIAWLQLARQRRSRGAASGPGAVSSQDPAVKHPLETALDAVPAGDGFQGAGAGAARGLPRRAWGFHRRRAAAALAAVSTAAFGVLYTMDSAERTATPAVLALDSGGSLPSQVSQYVEIQALARGDLRSAVGEHSVLHGRAVNTTTTFSGVRADLANQNGNDDLVVPLVRPGWQLDEPIGLFFSARRDAQPPSFGNGDVPASKLNGRVTVRGTLHRNGLPLFVVNSYRRAGFVVPETYYVVRPALSAFDREARRWAVLLIGWSAAVLLFGWSLLLNARKRKHAGPLGAS